MGFRRTGGVDVDCNVKEDWTSLIFCGWMIQFCWNNIFLERPWSYGTISLITDSPIRDKKIGLSILYITNIFFNTRYRTSIPITKHMHTAIHYKNVFLRKKSSINTIKMLRKDFFFFFGQWND